MATKKQNKEILNKIYELIGELRNAKNSAGSGDVIRNYSVTIAEAEKMLSYFKVFVIDGNYFDNE